MKFMNIRKITAGMLTGVVFIIPVIGLAQVGIPCNGPDCDFNSLITLANNVIKFLVFTVSVPLAALGFMVVGAKLVLNQNKEGAWSEAKQSFEYIGIGFGIILAAFLLIKFILSVFLNVGYTAFLLQ